MRSCNGRTIVRLKYLYFGRKRSILYRSSMGKSAIISPNCRWRMPSERRYFRLISSLFTMLHPKSSGPRAIVFAIFLSLTPAFVIKNMTCMLLQLSAEKRPALLALKSEMITRQKEMYMHLYNEKQTLFKGKGRGSEIMKYIMQGMIRNRTNHWPDFLVKAVC